MVNWEELSKVTLVRRPGLRWDSTSQRWVKSLNFISEEVSFVRTELTEEGGHARNYQNENHNKSNSSKLKFEDWKMNFLFIEVEQF